MRGRRFTVGAAAALTAVATAVVVGYRAQPRILGKVAIAACVIAALATVRLARDGRPIPARRVMQALLYGTVLFFAALCLQPFHGDVVGALGAIALSAVVVLLATTGAAGARGHRFATRACLALIAAESVLQVIAWLRPSSPLLAQWGSDAGQYVDSLRRPRAEGGAGGIPYNSWGDYELEPARKKPGGCLIVQIGDSFSGSTVPLPYHFTKVAERALPGCTVYNAGIARIGPREYQYLLKREALALDPDLIIVDLFLGNDIVDDYGCNPSPLRFWLDRENLLLYSVPKRLLSSLEPPATQLPWPPLDHAVEMWPWLADPTKEIPTQSPEKFFEVENIHARELCAPGAERYYPDFFVAMNELVRAPGKIKLAFMLIPDEMQVEDSVWTQVVHDNPGVTLDRDRPQRVVGDWLRARGLPYLDLLPVLRAAPPWSDGLKHFYLLRDTHFNARGNRVTGEAEAAFIKTLLNR